MLVLKGLPLAEEAFGDAFARRLRDIDVLVAPEHVSRAAALLEELGLEHHLPESWQDDAAGVLDEPHRWPCIKQAEFDGDRGFVELHWRLTVNPHLMPLDRVWLERPRVIDVSGVPTPVLPRLEGWWHLLVHGAEHDWARLKWVADVVALVVRDAETFTSPEALEAARARGLERCVASGLRVAEAALGPFLSDHARSWAHGVRGTRVAVQRALRALACDDVPTRQLSPMTLPQFARARLALRTEPRYRARELQCMLVEAGRSQGRPDPRLRDIARGPVDWLARVAARSGAGRR